MSHEGSLMPPQPAPGLNIPKSDAVATVYVIDTTGRIHAGIHHFVEKTIPGIDRVSLPVYAFVVSRNGRHILFDAGIRKDQDNWPPSQKDRIKGFPFDVRTPKDVADIIDENESETGIKRSDIENIILSHHHWDHMGDPNRFPKSTALSFGPGARNEYLPGYPTNPKSLTPEIFLEDREVMDIDFEQDGKSFNIGRCKAVDYFGDGSFYLLDTPGHTVGHMCGLVRTSTSPDSFLFLGGDSCHAMAAYKPSPWHPLPKTISSKLLPKAGPDGCPGERLLDFHPYGRHPDKPFYVPSEGFSADWEQSKETARKVSEFDAHPNVLVVMAHDWSLLPYLKFYPQSMNSWYDDGTGEKTRWEFLRDFDALL